MTEEEWFNPPDPADLLVPAVIKNRESKLRLFACQCVEDMMSTCGDYRLSPALKVAERLAHEKVDAREINSARVATALARQHVSAPFAHLVAGVDDSLNQSAIHAAQSVLNHRIEFEYVWKGGVADLDRCVILVHDIFGNPFHPVTFDPRWRTSIVVGLARAIYDDKAFERMPILADALMDGGCEDEQVIAHCRGNGPHVRGCWVVDLVLGKE